MNDINTCCMSRKPFRSSLLGLFCNFKIYRAIAVVLTMVCMTPLSIYLQSPVNYVLIIWGLFILLADLLSQRNCFKSAGSFILLAFIFANLITIVVNADSNLKSNFTVLLCNVILLFLYYPSSGKEDLLSCVREINLVFIVGMTAFGFVSLAIGIFTIDQEWLGYPQGIDLRNGRLWGISTNPNGLALLAFAALCASIINAYIARNDSSKAMRLLCSICGIISFAIIAMADARASMIALLFLVGFIAILFAAPRLSKNYTKAVSCALAVVIGCGCAAATYATYTGTQVVLGEAISNIHKDNLDDSFGIGRAHIEGLEEAMGEDITTGRLDIWETGFEIFASSPLAGVGKANILHEYAKINPEKPRANLHNGYIQILVSNGLFGFAAFFLFGLILYKRIIQAFADWYRGGFRMNNLLPLLLASVIVCLCAINLAESQFLYANTTMLIFLWSYVGFFMNTDPADSAFSVEKVCYRIKALASSSDNSQESIR